MMQAKLARDQVIDSGFGAPTTNQLPEDSNTQVAVLLCTCNGGEFLSEQLDSIASQTHPNLKLWVSDDGSTDNTKAILNDYKANWGQAKFSVLHGQQQGATQNFLKLTSHPDIQAKYFAWSDQDDVWEPEKLGRAISQLKNIPDIIPALYCSRTIMTNKNGRPLGLSPVVNKPPSFANALVQNIAGGNTMVINQAARKLLVAADSVQTVAHDWWLYQLVTGAGGNVFYDPIPSLRYRQHGGNLIGSNKGWSSSLHRIKLLLQGQFRRWNDMNLQALNQHRELLTSENQQTLDQFSSARNRRLLTRLWGLKKSGIYRQTLLGNFGLFVAALLKKL